jgi:hypothetical protein
MTAWRKAHIGFDQLIYAVGVAQLEVMWQGRSVFLCTTGSNNDYRKPSTPNITCRGHWPGHFPADPRSHHQAWYAAVNTLFGEFRLFKADYSVIPWT